MQGQVGLIVGRGQPPFARLGHRAGGGRARARASCSPTRAASRSTSRSWRPTLGPDTLVLPCDVQQDAEIDAVFSRIQRGPRRARLRRARRGLRAARRARPAASRRPRARASASRSTSAPTRSIALARGAQPLMQARGGGSIVTLSFLGSDRVFPNYNVMGVAKAALESSRAVPGGRSRPRRTSASTRSRPGRSRRWRRRASAGFSSILRRGPREGAAPPHHRDVGGRRAAAFLLGDAVARHHRRSADGRRRLPRPGYVGGVRSPAAPIADAADPRSDSLVALHDNRVAWHAAGGPAHAADVTRPAAGGPHTRQRRIA